MRVTVEEAAGGGGVMGGRAAVLQGARRMLGERAMRAPTVASARPLTARVRPTAAAAAMTIAPGTESHRCAGDGLMLRT